MSGERPKGAVEVRPGARFIGLVPQCPKEFGFDHEPMSEVIVALVDEVGRHCRLDRDRVSLTGFSYGASCTWAVATRHPEAFAAIVPVAGRLPADPELTARRLAGVAIWMAVGRGDETFYPLSEKMHAVLAAAQHPRLIYTVIPGGNHFCYGAVYRDPKFWPWLLAQRRGQSAGR